MLIAFAVFLPVRFGWLPQSGALDLVVDVVGIIGAGPPPPGGTGGIPPPEYPPPYAG